MEIITARSAGFCFGVRRAVKMAEQAAEQYGGCVSLGPLIHNDDAVRELERRGVRVVDSVDEVREGEAVVIRSHGVGPQVYEQLKAKNAVIIDATCPDVAKVHKRAQEEAAAGRKVFVVGEAKHPEVTAISAWCGGAEVFETPEDAERFAKAYPAFADMPVSLVCQTTALRANFEFSVKFIKKLCTNCKIFDTMCRTTFERQREAAELAEKCDAMVVIGGKNSANSRKLAETCRASCDKVFFIENAAELDVSALAGCDTVGVTAGASTPEWIIKEVNRKMSEEIITANENENAVLAEEAPQAENHEAAAPEETFEEMLERSIKTLHTGDKVTGVVAAITSTEISVDLGTKQSGYIPASEISDDPTVNVEDVIKVGDSIEAYVMRVNDVEGTVMLSKKRLDSVKVWDSISEARNEKAVLEGIVTEENKGGIVVNVKGVRVFVPASQSGLPKDAPMTELLKKKVKLRITEVNQPRRRVVGSIRAVQYEERRAKIQQVWDEIEVGKHYQGVVKSMTSYGAFVDIGGIDGMVHVSELSWSRIRQPADILNIGDEIDVYVISFDKETGKISLGHKDKSQDPWAIFMGKYGVGDVAEVKIVKLMPFGAFAEIVPGVDGLIHISQISDTRIGKPGDVLSEGQVVNAKIVNINEEGHKVSLSIRALLEPAAPEIKADEPVAEEDAADEVVYDTENPPEIEKEEAPAEE